MTNTLLSRKPFLDYDGQIQHLKSKNLAITDESNAKEILNQISYYNLINGYKDIFKDHQTHCFFEHTSIDDIYSLYILDTDLRAIFLKYILIVEKHIKSSISYHFTSLYGNGRSSYQSISNYEFNNHSNDIKKLFHKMNNKMQGNYISPQTTHYLTIYQDVPLWVLTTDLTLGETATMFRFLKGKCKTQICKDFHNIGNADLSKMLIILTKFRNICAHGNRLFNYKTHDALLDNLAHKKLHLLKSQCLYQYGKNDLFSVVISLKYLLSKNNFRDFYYELKKVFKKHNMSNKLLFLMGFPPNWMSILRIKVYDE